VPTYNLTAINVGGFALGESDKVVHMFSPERGLTRAVAKGARKPGTKMSGKSEALCVNKLLIATGRSLDIITQGESINTFRKLRTDLTRLTFGLYYAELTRTFGEGLGDDSDTYFDTLIKALTLLEEATDDPRLLCLEFELYLLRLMGLSPELISCVWCRQPLTDHNISLFSGELGGIGCEACKTRLTKQHATLVAEQKSGGPYTEDIDTRDIVYGGDARSYPRGSTYITPLVWKTLVLAENSSRALDEELPPQTATQKARATMSPAQLRALEAARRLIQRCLEDNAGKKMKTLDLLEQI
jgi:DNA repair protein RecO